jgi:phosphatidylglycerophosphate synthase
MCHRWLAAGVACFIGILLYRELTPLVGSGGPSSAAHDSGLLGARLRTWFRSRIEPLGDAMLDVGLSANAVTLSQLVGSVVCGIAYAHGWMFTAGWMLIACGTLDVLDGQMARRRGEAGPRGALMDSVVDRYAEAAVLVGLIAFYREGWALWAVLAAGLGGYLVSYARARAESLGVDCREGMLQRPERHVILGLSSMASAIVAHLSCRLTGRHDLVVLAVCVIAVLGHVTVLQRVAAAWRRLS